MNTIITIGDVLVSAEISMPGHAHLFSLSGRYLGYMVTDYWKHFYAVLENLSAQDVEFLKIMDELGYQIIP